MLKPGQEVTVYGWTQGKEINKANLEPLYPAIFVEFGMQFQQLKGEIANFSVAIVEKQDGFLELVPITLIRTVGINRSYSENGKRN